MEESKAFYTVFQLVILYVKDPCDRAAVSLVCKTLYEIDSLTRNHVTVPFCYATTPKQVLRRFPQVESLKLKGKPPDYMVVPEDWGAYSRTWVEEFGKVAGLKSINFRRMVVMDSDLELLAKVRGGILEVLKLDRCYGFSTDGLLHISRSCMKLRTLFLEKSTIIENDGEWLHVMALNNNVLQSLNFFRTNFVKIKIEDLEIIAKNCSTSLISVKVACCDDILELEGFFRAASSLQEFYGAFFRKPLEEVGEGALNEWYSRISFPPGLCRFGFINMGKNEMPILFPFASRLQKLDLHFSNLDTESHCVLIQRCPNLEILETMSAIEDRGLEVLASCCKKLKRLRIGLHAADDLEEAECIVSHVGLTALARGCLELEHLAISVSDITNDCLECIGLNLKKLCDFRLTMLDQDVENIDFPLDNGFRSLLLNCQKLRRLVLRLPPWCLTNVGLRYIGQFSSNVSYMFLGVIVESDAKLLEFSKGCPNLQKLEMKWCHCSGGALAKAIQQLPSLRYLWVEGCYDAASELGLDASLSMARPFWNIELIPGMPFLSDGGTHILAYHSLAGPRRDFPASSKVIPFEPTV